MNELTTHFQKKGILVYVVLRDKHQDNTSKETQKNTHIYTQKDNYTNTFMHQKGSTDLIKIFMEKEVECFPSF